LTSTIVGLAQNFVGSNNINLLDPNGQFGTRLAVSRSSAIRLTATGRKRCCQRSLHFHQCTPNDSSHLPPG
jgi:DNA gyrase/topoisomerase IV subunit A